ncbi:MAG TPA: competence/damage-inducible protein A [Ignavibacteria bacterium]|nr:competence/damage-inducible protein A [Ignavibacteria bacterium]HMR40594.1 competence/damage-inducible protein A [Ignavibacteria bacterium]
MRSKIISIGDEILLGQIVNTNAAFIGDKLFSAGFPVEKTVVIGDEEQILMDELKDSSENFDITIITGGLGPTHDDITKPTLVKFFNDKLVTDNKVLDHVMNIFSSRNIPMPEVNIAQALIPSKSKVLWNSNGTAPGIMFETNEKLIIAIPGVPFEMKDLINNEIIPLLKNKFGKKFTKVFLNKTLLTTGSGESSLNEMLGNVNEFLGDSKLAFLPSATGVRLRINAEGNTVSEAENKISIIEKIIRSKIQDYIFGENEDDLETVTGRILKERKKTLSVAESCTGGKISSRIVSVPGSSEYYTGGVCVYSNIEKIKLLNIREETLSKYGAVSEETAIEMAEGVREIMKTDYSLSTTGIAGPAGGSEKKPVGLVWIGFSSSEKTFAMSFLFGEERQRNIERASQRALEILRRELLKIKLIF